MANEKFNTHAWLRKMNEEKINEEYIESMNFPELEKHLNGIKKLWLEWKKGPETYYDDVPRAYKELQNFIAKWLKKNIK